MKKETLLTETESNTTLTVLPVENGIDLLKTNAQSSVTYQNCGTELIGRIRRNGMNTVLADEARGYIAQCIGEVQRMHALRRPFTTKLTEIQRQFVALEKDIDPVVEGSPAFQIAALLRNYLLEQTREAEAAGQRLDKNHERTGRRISQRTDLTDEEKLQAMQRADNRLITGRAELKLSEIPVCYVPCVTDPDGYLDLFRYWWIETGRRLSEKDLQRIFRPMLSFARKQARKGVRVDSPWIDYRPEPGVGKVA